MRSCIIQEAKGNGFLIVVLKIQCDPFGTRPKKMRISQRLFIRFWTCIYDHIPCFMRSMSILFCRSLTGWVKHFLPRDFEYCSLSGNLQRICGSTWWWRAPKRLFSAGWSHMPHLEWEHDRNRKLFWWPDYFESLMAAKISWLKSARFFPVGRLKRKSLCQQATHHTGTGKQHSTWNCCD